MVYASSSDQVQSVPFLSASLADNKLTISGSTRYIPSTDPDPTGTDLTATYLFVSASNTALGNDLYFRQNGNITKWKWIEGQLASGLLYGGVVTFSGSFVYVSSGSGIIIDYNATTGSEISPLIDYVTWGPITASVTNITSSQVTYLYIDNNGALQQQSQLFTPEQFQQYIPLGAVGHFDYANVSAFGGDVNTAYGQQTQTNNFIDAFGPLKINGYDLAGQSGNLSLSVGSGTTFVHGGFYTQNQDDPSIFNSTSQVTASIVRCYISSSTTIFDTNNGTLYTTINPGYYNNTTTGVTSSLSNNNWTIQRVFSFAPTNTLYVYYGQSVYSTFAGALDGLSADPFVEGETKAFTTFVGYLVVKSNATSMTDSDSRILSAGLFRGSGAGSGGGGISVASLEDLSDVTITSPVTGEALIYNAGIWINGYPTSASYATNALSSSFAITASYAENAGSSFPYTGSAIITGSLIVTGSLSVTDGNFNLSQSSYSNENQGSLGPGAVTLLTDATSSYISAFYNYALTSGSNSRAGQIIAIWNGGSIQHTEVTTQDIGNTSDVYLTASLSGADILLTTVLPTSGWTIKSVVNLL